MSLPTAPFPFPKLPSELQDKVCAIAISESRLIPFTFQNVDDSLHNSFRITSPWPRPIIRVSCGRDLAISQVSQRLRAQAHHLLCTLPRPLPSGCWYYPGVDVLWMPGVKYWCYIAGMLEQLPQDLGFGVIALDERLLRRTLDMDARLPSNRGLVDHQHFSLMWVLRELWRLNIKDLVFVISDLEFSSKSGIKYVFASKESSLADNQASYQGSYWEGVLHDIPYNAPSSLVCERLAQHLANVREKLRAIVSPRWERISKRLELLHG